MATRSSDLDALDAHGAGFAAAAAAEREMHEERRLRLAAEQERDAAVTQAIAQASHLAALGDEIAEWAQELDALRSENAALHKAFDELQTRSQQLVTFYHRYEKTAASRGDEFKSLAQRNNDLLAELARKTACADAASAEAAVLRSHLAELDSQVGAIALVHATMTEVIDTLRQERDEAVGQLRIAVDAATRWPTSTKPAHEAQQPVPVPSTVCITVELVISPMAFTPLAPRLDDNAPPLMSPDAFRAALDDTVSRAMEKVQGMARPLLHQGAPICIVDYSEPLANYEQLVASVMALRARTDASGPPVHDAVRRSIGGGGAAVDAALATNQKKRPAQRNDERVVGQGPRPPAPTRTCIACNRAIGNTCVSCSKCFTLLHSSCVTTRGSLYLCPTCCCS